MEKKKERSAAAWADRLDKEKSVTQERIAKRELNITARRAGVDPQVIADKQAAQEAQGAERAPAAKRPRLFMHFKQKEAEALGEGASTAKGGSQSNRSGFEGKKQGYLNTNKQKTEK
jgi:hypothetical protein